MELTTWLSMLRLSMYFFAGFVLASGGITISRWQFWVLGALVFGIDLIGVITGV